MSNQSSATQKPKPGSLRDRIAAFEKSASATPVNAPPTRPKPAAFATWKPKQTSPPPSPPASQTEHAQGSTMSASDARESITKGGSLKDRMAALQNKGAFGAPPPVGPKPVAERPKWKPPPVVQYDGANSRGEGISAIEKSMSPPLAVGHEQSTGDSVQGEKDPVHGTSSEGVNEEAETAQDPEEEERQRRAAIAARMARLGGARVGMAPPIIGKKPLVRRPTQEEEPRKNVEDTKSAEIPLHLDRRESPEEQNPSLNEIASVSPELDTQKPGLAPSRKSSLNTTAEVDSGHSPRIPASMPVPAVPRRAGPPRKKPSKPTAPPPEPPKEEVKAETDVDLVEPTSDPPHEDPEPTLETSTGPTTKGASSITNTKVGDPPALHDSEELEKSSTSLLPPSDTHSPVLHPVDPPVHTLETHRAIEAVDEVALQHQSAIPPAQPAINDVTECVVEHDDAAHKDLNAESVGGMELTSQADLSSGLHPEPSKSVRKDFLHDDGQDQSDTVDNDYKLDNPTDQDPLLLEIDPPEFIDSSQLSGHNSVVLEQRPLPPPRRIVPSAPEGDTDQGHVEELDSEEEMNENLARSHLLIPPPKERKIHPNIQHEDDSDGSENDAPALPVPHRRSLDLRSSRMPSQQSGSSSELDSDHDGQPLPVPPRPTVWVVPPLQSQETLQEGPRNVATSISTPIPLDREVMDDDEGDPIDPDFHIPSRRTSYLDLTRQASPPSTHPALLSHSPPISGSQPSSPPQPTQPEETGVELEENADETRRRTIAERMARLGAIQFGTVAIPTAVQDGEQGDVAILAEDKPDEPSNEEGEERARKERIASKLASMGGMRIGMMPMGISTMPAKREETAESLPSNSVVSVQPSLAPHPPGQTSDTEPGTGSPITSDDGVRVEAEESEAEEVTYQDAVPEEIPPIPSRSGRPTRRQSSGDTAVSPPPPTRRPPVPVTPSRRMSTRVPSPHATPPPQRKDSSHTPQYDYVMVDQIESQETLPTRRSSEPRPARSASEVSQTAELQENISSQWELPSIPTSTLEFESGADLSLSWSDAGEAPLHSQPTHSASFRGKPQRQSTNDKSLSSDDLIALWGRVGVQVCEVATTIFEKSKKSLIGDGTYAGFVKAVLADVPNAAQVTIDAREYGYLIYSQNGSVVQKRASEIMPGDIVEIHDARFKGHKGLQIYQQTVGGSEEPVSGIVAEFETKRSKVRVFQANQHVGQQTVESVSYRLEDLKSGTIKVYRVLEAL